MKVISTPVRRSLVWFVVPGLASVTTAAEPPQPLVSTDVVFEEQGGMVAAEAEHFFNQTKSGKRAWYVHSSKAATRVKPDGDPSHVAGASGGAYLEILPDTRRTHADKLISGENFSNKAGAMGIVHYKVNINKTGRYYVWVRAFSSGSEDNGIHVGLDGTWPASGQRLQWCEGKRTWRWESKQRTQKEHCGVPHLIYLDINDPGEHTISFSMREDGFEFDKWFMTTDKNFARPKDTGPASTLHRGKLPEAFAYIAPKKSDPKMSIEPVADPLSLTEPQVGPRGKDGDWSVKVTGELKQWHKVTLTMDGPFAHERDQEPNPFTDYRMTVSVKHESGWPRYEIPGYFAADGNAGESSAESGNKWRAHFSPDKTGKWEYSILFEKSRGVIYINPIGKSVARGEIRIVRTDKTGRDFRGKGRLTYVGKHHLQFAGSKEYFLKAGPDAPETLLGYADFDGTVARKQNVPLKTWQPHVRDWKDGDPTWKGGKGKGLIGALNYLASKGCNAFSFLTYNAGGDGDNVWPFVARDTKFNYDCSKLDQWQIVFDHAQANGLYLHFKLQEQEMDDDRQGHKEVAARKIKTSLDGGDNGHERKLYMRELIARFGHSLALNWNLGEENTQSPKQQRDMSEWIHQVDPFDHHIVVHTFPDQQDKVYPTLLGQKSVLTGASLQNNWNQSHRRTLKWVTDSAKVGKPWVVANDEQGQASMGVPPDPGYDGADGFGTNKDGKKYDMHDIRKHTLWGTLMAGGAGVEYYFGYKLKQNDLICEDFRSRDQSWDYCRIALEFFRDNKIPFHEMKNENRLIGNGNNQNTKYCLARRGIYLVYLANAETSELDLTGDRGQFSIYWFNPRTGGELTTGSVKSVAGGQKVSLGSPPADPNEDWLAVLRLKPIRR